MPKATTAAQQAAGPAKPRTRKAGTQSSPSRRSPSSRGPARDRTSPSSGVLPFVVLLGMVAAAAGIVLLLYRSGPSGVPQPQAPDDAPSATPTPGCPVPPTHDRQVIRTVYRVGVERGVADTVMLAAFETGWVESHMQNLDCGDRDSLGVFQQRPSQGWGTPAQVRNVRYAANRFFAIAEHEHAESPGSTAGDLAQRVQVSAFPDRYDEAEPKARELLAEARNLVR